MAANDLSYAFDANSGETPQSLQRKRDMLAQLLQGGSQRAPQNVGEGINSFATSLADAFKTRRLQAQIDAGQKAGAAGADSAFGGLNLPGFGAPAAQAPPNGQPQMQDANVPALRTGPTAPSLALDQGGSAVGMKPYQDAIAKIESGGNYGIRGPVTGRGDRAYGKYQVMGANIPQWTQAALGRVLSPQEFLDNPQAQDAVFNHRFGGYLKNNSPADAASMWFTGRPLAQGGNAHDQLGTSGNKYAQMFSAGLPGGNEQPAQRALNMQIVAPDGSPVPDPSRAVAPQNAIGGAGQPQLAQAAPQGPAPVQASPASAPAAMNGPSIPDLLKVMENPFLSDSKRSFLQTLLARRQAESDPTAQLGLEKTRGDIAYTGAQIQNLLHPQISPGDAARLELEKQKQAFEQNKPISVNNSLVTRKGKVVYDGSAAETHKYQVIGEDQFGAKVYGYPPPFDAKAGAAAQTGSVAQPSVGAGAVAGQGDKAQVMDLHGDTFLSTLDPQLQGQVRAIVEGRAPYPTGMLLKTPYGQRLAQYVTQTDPTFEAGNSTARVKVRNDFSAGGQGSAAGTITAGNTAIQHLGQLSHAAETLGNYNTTVPGNNLFNRGRNLLMSGPNAVPQTEFNNILSKYVEEATKFYRGTGGTESDIQRDLGNLNVNMSPSELRKAIQTNAHLMQSKISVLQERWRNGMGPLVADYPIFQPESQVVMDTINKRATAGGKEYTFNPATGLLE